MEPVQKTCHQLQTIIRNYFTSIIKDDLLCSYTLEQPYIKMMDSFSPHGFLDLEQVITRLIDRTNL